MITSTPVKLSKVRILRPSRPMIRPFMLSSGKWTVVMVCSAAYSPAIRCMACAKMSFAILLDLSRISRSASLIFVAISCVKLFSVSVKITSRASEIVITATRSNSACFWPSSSPICFSRSLICLVLSVRLCSLLSNNFSLLVKFSSFRSRE